MAKYECYSARLALLFLGSNYLNLVSMDFYCKEYIIYQKVIKFMLLLLLLYSDLILV